MTLTKWQKSDGVASFLEGRDGMKAGRRTVGTEGSRGSGRPAGLQIGAVRPAAEQLAVIR